MLRKWTIGNFKSIAAPVALDLAPITVLAGANSSGKSTVLQSILAVSQTLRATTGKYPLVLNGEYVRLGYLADIVHNQSKNKPVVLGFELAASDIEEHTIAPSLFPIVLSLQITADGAGGDRPYGRLAEVSLHWRNGRLVLEELTDRDMSIRKHSGQLQVPADIQNELQKGMYTFVPRGESSLWFRFIPPFLPQFDLHSFLPGRWLETYDHQNASLRQELLDISDLIAGVHDMFSPDTFTKYRQNNETNRRLKRHIQAVFNSPKPKRGLETQYYQYRRVSAVQFGRDRTLEDGIRYIMREVPKLHRGVLAEEIKASVDDINIRMSGIPYTEIGVYKKEAPEPLNRVIAQIVRYFSKKLYYLGPLRVSPQYLYILPPFPDIKYVGSRGEFSAAVLERYQGEPIEFPIPPGTYKRGQEGTDSGPLIYALQVWLEYMGLIEKVKTQDRGKMGTELTVRSAGVDRDLDLTSIGVGVSQVLPTLVGCLVAPPGTTFLLEQPELHLHPKVQGALADFFIGLIRTGKQVILETHSEYLINRLRRRVAEDERDDLAGNIRIYFVEREQGQSNFRAVNLTEYGATIDWPKGFFDEGPTEAQLIMEAAMNKRRRKMAEKGERQ